MESFILEQNVLRFSELLKTESDPAARKTLSRLLLDEENKFAVTAERLDRTDGHLVNCKAHITRQHDLIDRLNATAMTSDRRNDCSKICWSFTIYSSATGASFWTA